MQEQVNYLPLHAAPAPGFLLLPLSLFQAGVLLD